MRVEPRSNRTRLAQCDGVSYGRDPTCRNSVEAVPGRVLEALGHVHGSQHPDDGVVCVVYSVTDPPDVSIPPSLCASSFPSHRSMVSVWARRQDVKQSEARCDLMSCYDLTWKTLKMECDHTACPPRLLRLASRLRG